MALEAAYMPRKIVNVFMVYVYREYVLKMYEEVSVETE